MIHPQTIEKNHLSQVVQPLLTTTVTQVLDLLHQWHQVSFQFSDLKGLILFIIGLPMFYLYSYLV